MKKQSSLNRKRRKDSSNKRRETKRNVEAEAEKIVPLRKLANAENSLPHLLPVLSKYVTAAKEMNQPRS